MKRLAALALVSLLAGCGFHPMYSSALDPELSSIFVDPIAERDGYELRNQLIDLLHSDGVVQGKRYHLTVTLAEASQGIAQQNNAAITRYNETLNATYVLTDAAGKELTRGTQKQLSAYDVAPSPYATLSAQQDAGKRAAEDMAERIHLDLGVWFRQNPK
jgi:LPS-assembly lipoprotein